MGEEPDTSGSIWETLSAGAASLVKWGSPAGIVANTAGAAAADAGASARQGVSDTIDTVENTFTKAKEDAKGFFSDFSTDIKLVAIAAGILGVAYVIGKFK
jgi:hypothetical protein